MDLLHLPSHEADGAVRVVVEAPRGSTIKCKYEPALGAFVFQRALPLGMAYPFDWGFVPDTLADDGDPLDAMVLFDQPSWPGCVIPAKPIGVLRLTQRESGADANVRNDRVIAVPVHDARYAEVHDLPARVREELEHFFVSISALTDKTLDIEGWEGARAAAAVVDAAVLKRRG